VYRKTNTISKLLSSVILLLVAVFAIGCVTTGGEPELTPASAHPKAPDVTFRFLDGTQTKLSDYAGESVVVVNFWGLRCQNCIEEMPFLERLHNKYGSKGLVILGVNTDGVDEKLLLKFMPQLPVKVNYPIVVDPDFTLADAYQMMAAPLTIVVAKDGTVRYRHEGYEPSIEGTYVEIIEDLLSQ
jgi:peroxiredoxin